MKHEFDETIFHQNLHEGVHLRKLNSSKFHSGYSYKNDLAKSQRGNRNLQSTNAAVLEVSLFVAVLICVLWEYFFFCVCALSWYFFRLVILCSLKRDIMIAMGTCKGYLTLKIICLTSTWPKGRILPVYFFSLSIAKLLRQMDFTTQEIHLKFFCQLRRKKKKAKLQTRKSSNFGSRQF